MPKVSIRFAASAVADLEALKGWYANQGVSDVGDRFVAEIVAHIEGLGDHPDMSRVVLEFDQPFLREIIHPPFRIVYRREPRHLRVVRVWRSERVLALPDDEET